MSEYAVQFVVVGFFLLFSFKLHLWVISNTNITKTPVGVWLLLTWLSYQQQHLSSNAWWSNGFNGFVLLVVLQNFYSVVFDIGLLQWLSSKESACSVGDAGDMGSILGSGKTPGGGNGNPLQYPWLGNPMDRGAWWATVHRVTKSWTWLTIHTYLTSFIEN